MAKELIPPDPIPVGEATAINESMYCASFMNYSKTSYSNTSRRLLEYLESEFESSDLGGTTRAFVACYTTVKDVRDNILSEQIVGINDDTIDKYITLSQYDADVIIFANLY